MFSFEDNRLKKVLSGQAGNTSKKEGENVKILAREQARRVF